MLIKLPVKNGGFVLISPVGIESVVPDQRSGIYRVFYESSYSEETKELRRILRDYDCYYVPNSTTGKKNTVQFNPQPDYYKTPSSIGLHYFEILGIVPDGKDCRSFIRHLETSRDWGFYLCSAVKYLWRLGCKGTNLDITKDLKKAKQYLDWELAESSRPLDHGERLRIENCVKAIEQELQ